MKFLSLQTLTDEEIQKIFASTCDRSHQQDQGAHVDGIRGCAYCYYEDIGDHIEEFPICNPALFIRRQTVRT